MSSFFRKSPRVLLWSTFFLGLVIIIGACANHPRYRAEKPISQDAPIEKIAPISAPNSKTMRGYASYYGKKFHGRQTANGQIFDMYGFTAAHKTLAFGTRLRVTYPKTGESVVVVINDRGPFVVGRVLDLSYAAAKKIGLHTDGVAEVEYRILE